MRQQRVRWLPFPPEKGERQWDWVGENLYGDNPFQSSAWGEYKKNWGWEPQRWVASNENQEVVGSLQLLKKPLPMGRSLLWAPGGPLFDFQRMAPEDFKILISAGLREICRMNRAVYARFYSFQSPSPPMVRGFSDLGRTPSRRLGSGTTVEVDLSLSEEQLLSGMARKHRYLVRRFGGNSIQWHWGKDDALINNLESLHREMSSRKNVLATKNEDSRSLVSAFQDNILILIGSLGREAVTGCMVLLKGRSAFYWRAATTPKGREISAAYPMIFQLFKLLKARAIEHFDFGGILPRSPSAAGINHFKKGFGGKVVEYVGEWEWANPSWVRWGVNTWMAWRRNE